ncbi:LOW QUALITY PROTEIN: beta-2-glycoprotein 1 [Liasis olivaceus]
MFPILFGLCIVGIIHVALAGQVCPRPPEVPLATININKEEYSPGEEIIYSCDLGFIPQSDSMSYTCPLSGIWPNMTFKCIRPSINVSIGMNWLNLVIASFVYLFVPLILNINIYLYFKTAKKCPNPGPLNNGQIHITDLNYLSVITFSCNHGFVLLGPTSNCQLDGRWRSRLPECQATNYLSILFMFPLPLAPCKIPVKRATVLYNGQKVKVQDLLKPRIRYAETIWFFCEKEKCSYEVPTQCKDGHILVPKCFEGRNMFFSFDYHGNR